MAANFGMPLPYSSNVWRPLHTYTDRVFPMVVRTFSFYPLTLAAENLIISGSSLLDLDLSNIVPALPDFSHLSETDVISKLTHDPEKMVLTVRMKDGSSLPSGVPDTICEPCSFYMGWSDEESLDIRLVDFGEGWKCYYLSIR